MIVLKGFIFVSFLLYLFNFTGFALDKLCKTNNITIRSIVGFSIHIIFVNTLYFGLNLNSFEILFLLIFLIIIGHIFFFEKLFIFDFFKSFKLSFLIIVFYLFLAQFYGEQFYMFRGNHYDAINYTGMSLVSSLHTYDEIPSLLNLNNSIQNSYLKIFANLLLTDRPIVSIFIGLFYFENIIDLYLVNYLFKILFVSLIPSAVVFFFEQLNFTNDKIKIYFISQLFVFSFFIFYIAEIDAYSQLSVFAISLVFVAITFFSLNICKLEPKININIIIISSAFFLLYPEQALIFFIFSLVFILLLNIKQITNINLVYNFLFFAIPFLILTSFGNFYIYIFLFKQFNLAVNSSFDWWGYFGAFVLGAKNIVINLDHVISIKKHLIDGNNMKIFKYIHELNKSEYGFFYLLNIIPSIFGVYFINGIDFLNLYFVYFVNIILTFSIIFFISSNTKKIFLEKNVISSFYKYLISFLLISCLIIFANSNYWLILKFFFYFSFFIFLFSVIKFEKKKIKINYLLSFFIVLFPIYKFNSFNYGIGTYDSFPSILKKNYKVMYNLNISEGIIRKCPKIDIIKKNLILDKFFSTKLIYYKIDFQFINESRGNVCEI